MTTELQDAIKALHTELRVSANGYGAVTVDEHSLRTVLNALSSPPADDVREALYRAMYTSEPTPDRIASDLFVNRILSDPNIEVRPYGTVTDTEVEWEYGVRHVALDGWPTERAHFSLEDARQDLYGCGMNCHLIRRNIARETGKWEPFDGEARS